MVYLGVSKVHDMPGEYRVFFRVGSSTDEGKTYYTSDLVDAGLTLSAISRNLSRQGEEVRISNSLTTKRALKECAWIGRGSEQEVDDSLDLFSHQGRIPMPGFLQK